MNSRATATYASTPRARRHIASEGCAHFARERVEKALIARATGAERPRAEIPHGVIVRWRGLLSRRGDQLLREAWAKAHGMKVATTCAFSHDVRSDLPHCGV